MDLVLYRLGDPMIARAMSMSTIAVTIGYIGRLGVPNDRLINTLLHFFSGNKKPGVQDRISQRLVNRILSDPQLDMAHMTGILESINDLDLWGRVPLAIPLAIFTRRLVLRDGIHNVKATPLCQLAKVFLKNDDFGMSDEAFLAMDSAIDQAINETFTRGLVSTNWCLQGNVEGGGAAHWRTGTVFAILEGLLKHELYIKSTPSVIARCVDLRKTLKIETSPVPWESLPANLRDFLTSEDIELGS
jgi:hypothetical protein